MLTQDDGTALTANDLERWMRSATTRAGLEPTGGLHILRHTFCSHLALRGAPAKAIQELAGHKQLSTTFQYMHLSPAHRQQAIELLDTRPNDERFSTPGAASASPSPHMFGDMVETASAANGNAC